MALDQVSVAHDLSKIFEKPKTPTAPSANGSVLVLSLSLYPNPLSLFIPFARARALSLSLSLSLGFGNRVSLSLSLSCSRALFSSSLLGVETTQKAKRNTFELKLDRFLLFVLIFSHPCPDK